MARKLRVEYPGAIYHVMNRGDRREPIFRDNADRQRFVETLAEVCAKTGWQVHAYVLMPSHFHLVVETPQPNLVAGMKWFLGTYTSRFNRRHKLFGHLFSGRYKSLLVDGLGSGYLKSVCDYVHLNPARLVSGRGTISAGVAGAHERADGGGALRGGAGADGGSDGGTNHRGGIETAAVARGRAADPAQRGCGESGVGGAVAGQDHDDGGLDRGAPGDGKPGLSEPPAVSPEEVWREVAIIKNQPLLAHPTEVGVETPAKNENIFSFHEYP
jgi:REP element-mobilizing transposase RayT